MFVKDLQLFLSKFTAGNKNGTHQGNAVSLAKIFVERDGYLEEIKRMEVHEHNIIGQPGLRLVLKTQKERKLILPDKINKTDVNA